MITWPDLPVVGLLGASYVNGTAPEGELFNGSAIAGGSYVGLCEALNAVQNMKFFKAETTAKGGCTAFDGLPGPGFLGYKSQFDALLRRTTWIFTGKSSLKVLIIDFTNSCLHNMGSRTGQPCTDAEFDAVFDEMEAVAIMAHARGVKVLVTGYPDYLDLDVEQLKTTYLLEWFISEDRYKDLNNRLAERIKAWPVEYFPVWQTVGINTFDFLHPDQTSQERVARALMVKLLRLLNA